MKIRKGFVSNSSSSSYILCYDKTKALNQPEDIIKYIKEKDNSLIIRGWDLGEGDDIFELSEDQRSLIRKFPKQFINANSGTKIKKKWFYDGETQKTASDDITIPKIEAFPEAEMISISDIDYKDIDVDMSDIPSPSDIENTEEKSKVFHNWQEIHSKRVLEKKEELTEQKIKETKEEYLKNNNIPSENIVAEKVAISWRSCTSENWCEFEFADRYLEDEDFEEIVNFPMLFKKYNFRQPKPFTIVCRDILDDKQTIIGYLKTHEKFNPCYLTWFNEVYDEVYNKVTCLDLFEVGDEERNLLLNNEDAFLKSQRKVKFFTEAQFINQYGDLSGYREIRKVLTGFGKVCFIPKGNDLKDFKKEFLK